MLAFMASILVCFACNALSGSPVIKATMDQSQQGRVIYKLGMWGSKALLPVLHGDPFTAADRVLSVQNSEDYKQC